MAGTEGAKIPPNTERPQGLRHNEIIDRFTPVNGDPAFDAVAIYWQAKPTGPPAWKPSAPA
ncbi:hypothetical protein ACFXK0_26715 [Nocardia sp. NPDC059177]|uniref:hypothetical protein n=1 Tax=Nocardia sp. NPDC059177 TaxID=3346759 RepID=UPI00367D6189